MNSVPCFHDCHKQHTNGVFVACRAALGGAAYIAATGANVVSQTNITNSKFLLNSASRSAPRRSNGVEFDYSGGGGALYLNGGVTLMNGSTFRQNNASGYGGALVYIQECFQPGTWVHMPYTGLQQFIAKVCVVRVQTWKQCLASGLQIVQNEQHLCMLMSKSWWKVGYGAGV